MSDGRCDMCRGTGTRYEGDMPMECCIYCDGTGFDDEDVLDENDDWDDITVNSSTDVLPT